MQFLFSWSDICCLVYKEASSSETFHQTTLSALISNSFVPIKEIKFILKNVESFVRNLRFGSDLHFL